MSCILNVCQAYEMFFSHQFDDVCRNLPAARRFPAGACRESTRPPAAPSSPWRTPEPSRRDWQVACRTIGNPVTQSPMLVRCWARTICPRAPRHERRRCSAAWRWLRRARTHGAAGGSGAVGGSLRGRSTERRAHPDAEAALVLLSCSTNAILSGANSTFQGLQIVTPRALIEEE